MDLGESAKIRFASVAAFVACIASLWWISDQFDLVILFPLGWMNAAAASGIAAWYASDAARSPYALPMDGPPKPTIRFWRKIALLASIYLGLASAGYCLFQAARPLASTENISSNEVAALLALTGAFVAAFGWLYTTFEKEKADRASLTLQAIRDQFYGEPTATLHMLLAVKVAELRKDRSAGLTLDQLQTRIEKKVTKNVVKSVGAGDATEDSIERSDGLDPGKHAGRTLEELSTELLNSLNQMSLGVRLGQFDIRTIHLSMRPRLLRLAHTFSMLIYVSTRSPTKITPEERAMLHPPVESPKAQTLTWEHFLWLVSLMNPQDSDQVNDKAITLPPVVKSAFRGIEPKRRS